MTVAFYKNISTYFLHISTYTYIIRYNRLYVNVIIPNIQKMISKNDFNNHSYYYLQLFTNSSTSISNLVKKKVIQ